MELAVEVKEETPHASPRTASSNDPQECGALRQGGITLIHSAPTGERFSLQRSVWKIKEFVGRLAVIRGFRGTCYRPPLRAGPTGIMPDAFQSASMPAMGLFHRRKLLRSRSALMGRLPGLIRHAIDLLAALVLA